MARVLKALEGRLVLGQKVSILSECGFASMNNGLSVNDKGSSPDGGGQTEEARQADPTDFGEPPEGPLHQDPPGSGEL